MIAALITLSILEILTIIIMLAGYERMLAITARLNNHGRWITELHNRTKNKAIRIRGENYDIRGGENYDIRAGRKDISAMEHNK